MFFLLLGVVSRTSRACRAARESRAKQLPLFYRMYRFVRSSKLKGNMASDWKRFRRKWSNYEIASRLVKQPNEERTATFCSRAGLGADALDIVDGLNFANDKERKDIDVVLEKLEVRCVGETNETYE